MIRVLKTWLFPIDRVSSNISLLLIYAHERDHVYDICCGGILIPIFNGLLPFFSQTNYRISIFWVNIEFHSIVLRIQNISARRILLHWVNTPSPPYSVVGVAV